MASALDEPCQTNLRQDDYPTSDDCNTVFMSPTPELGQISPMGDLGEVPGYSDLLVEYFREHQSKYGFFAEDLAGLFPEGDPGDDSSRYFNGYPQFPSPIDTWEMNHTNSSTVVDSPVGPSSDPAPASPQPPPSPPPSTSTASSRSQKLYNCTYCGRLFDRYSRARDCRNMDLGLTPHHCVGKCGIVGCSVAYGSEALLLEHTKPRAVQCPSCPRTLSKKNIARHQRKFCRGRSLPAGPATTEVDD